MITNVIAGRYHILEKVGQGGAAEVYRAMDTRLGRVVAIKLLRDTYSHDTSFTHRFENEARAAARLSHPNIVDVYDYEQSDGQYFIAMEYVQGQNLKDYIRANGPLDEGQTRNFTTQILEGLGAAHAAGLVHRDMKPQNVLVAQGGRLKIADFGIAKAMGDAGMTEAGIAFGTPHYLAPEQARGDAVTPRTDLYAVGVMMYEMLSGRLPFDGENSMKVAYSHVFDEPVALSELMPGLSGAMASIVERAMAKDPEDRFADANEMQQALESLPLGGANGVPAAGAAAAGEATVAMPVMSTPQPRAATSRAVTVAGPGRTTQYGPPAAEPSRRFNPLWAVLPLSLLLFGCLAFAISQDLLGGIFDPQLGAAPIGTATVVAVGGETPTSMAVVTPTAAEIEPTEDPTATVPPTATSTPAPTETATSIPSPTSTPTPAPPKAPSDLEANLLSGGVVQLTWRDNSNGEDSFVIERYIDDPPYERFVEVEAGRTSYTDNDVQAGRTYGYRVRALKDGKLSGGPTEEISIPLPPTATSTPQPTSTPRPAPTPTNTPQPTPTPTQLPDPTVAPDPPVTGTEEAGVDLDADEFTGGYSNPDGYKGEDTAQWVYGQGSGYEQMSASFQIRGTPLGDADGEAGIGFRGFDAEDRIKSRIRIEINGTRVFEGRNGLPNDFNNPDTGNWGVWAVEFRATVLKSGNNTVTITNLEPNGAVNRPPFFLIDRARIGYYQ